MSAERHPLPRDLRSTSNFADELLDPVPLLVIGQMVKTHGESKRSVKGVAMRRRTGRFILLIAVAVIALLGVVARPAASESPGASASPRGANPSTGLFGASQVGPQADGS